MCDFFVLFFCFLSSTQLFAYWFCSHQFAELGSIHCLAFSPRACSLAFLCLAILFLAICRTVFFLFLFLYTDFFSQACVYAFLSLVILLISAILRAHFLKFFWGIFTGRSSSTALFFFLALFFSFTTPYIGLLCFLRMHAINSCVGDT